MEFSRPEYWSGEPPLLQEIFPTQGSNPGLPHCRQILYLLSHKGSPRILDWVAYPFASRSSRPRNPPGSPALQADSLPTEPWGKPSQMTKRHIQRCSTSLLIREIQIKTTMRYLLSLVRKAIRKTSTNNESWNGCGEKGTLLHCGWESKLA